MSGGVLLSHPTGNANVRQALRALHERGMLAAFYTAVAWNGDAAWNKLLPLRLSRELNRRAFPDVPSRLIHTSPLRELLRVALGRSGRRGLRPPTDSPFSVEAVYRHADKVAAKALESFPADAVYAYDGGALSTFRAARRRGIQTNYELPVASWHARNKLMSEERALQPAYSATLPAESADSEWIRRKDEELELADRVIVPSLYVQSTLPNSIPAERVQVVPYGAPSAPVAGLRQQGQQGKKSPKLRLLYVGQLTQRKGISYLLDAVKKLGAAVEFTIIGSRVAPCAPVDEALKSYRWLPTMPHAQVLDEMERHDVLAFPTLSEGLALVILEALSRGMAVVTTPNSGAVGIVRDGKEGFIVPIRSSEALAAKLALLAADRALLAAMQEAALRRARECSWERYRELLAATLGSALRVEGGVPA